MNIRALLALPLLLALAACSARPAPAPAPAAEPVNNAGSGCVSAAAAGSKVAFTAPDGARVVGIELGKGRTGVVLAHMDQSHLCEWLPYGAQLAAKGYRVLAFDFAGEGDSGPADGVPDLTGEATAAAASMRSRGVTDIVLMGASKGGTAIVAAGAAIDPAPKALVSLSGPAQFNSADALAAAPRLTSPVLYVAGSDDAGFAAAAERLGKATPPAVRRGVLIVPGAQHGTSLLGGEGFEKVTSAIGSLLAKDAPPLP